MCHNLRWNSIVNFKTALRSDLERRWIQWRFSLEQVSHLFQSLPEKWQQLPVTPALSQVLADSTPQLVAEEKYKLSYTRSTKFSFALSLSKSHQCKQVSRQICIIHIMQGIKKKSQLQNILSVKFCRHTREFFSYSLSPSSCTLIILESRGKFTPVSPSRTLRRIMWSSVASTMSSSSTKTSICFGGSSGSKVKVRISGRAPSPNSSSGSNSEWRETDYSGSNSEWRERDRLLYGS